MKAYIPDCDYFVYYWDLPWKIRGMVSPNDDGTYSIILNRRLSPAWQLMAYVHEVEHIRRSDFYSSLPISVVESA